MFNRVSWASAASESTANDVFILPKQWKYRILRRDLSTDSRLGIICHTQVGPQLGSKHRSSLPKGERMRVLPIGIVFFRPDGLRFQRRSYSFSVLRSPRPTRMGSPMPFRTASKPKVVFSALINTGYVANTRN